MNWAVHSSTVWCKHTLVFRGHSSCPQMLPWMGWQQMLFWPICKAIVVSRVTYYVEWKHRPSRHDVMRVLKHWKFWNNGTNSHFLMVSYIVRAFPLTRVKILRVSFWSWVVLANLTRCLTIWWEMGPQRDLTTPLATCLDLSPKVKTEVASDDSVNDLCAQLYCQWDHEMFGQVPRLPVNLMFWNILMDNTICDYNTYVKSLVNDLHSAMLLTQETSEKKQKH